MKKVLIITRLLPQYRIDFINRLKDDLARHGVELSYVYGKSKNQDALKKDEVDLEWGTYIPNKTWNIKGMELVWQPCLAEMKDKDLIIVEQANRNLINYFLILRRLFSKKKFAFWGHGRNMQAEENDWRNNFKLLFLKQCDWWFAYTQKVKELLIHSSYPPDRITCVQNAIDTTSLSRHYDALPNDSLTDLRQELGIFSDRVGIYCGGIYGEKRIPFLLEACDQVKEQVKDFHLIVIGSGADASLVREAAKTRQWVHYVGPKFGLERVPYFKASAITLMPGLVGLGILDTFAMQTPLVTTDFPFHSPEIEYLQNGINGVMTQNSLDAYVAGVVKILRDEPGRQHLKEGCRLAAQKYTVDQMVENFSAGVLQALAIPGRVQQKEQPALR